MRIKSGTFSTLLAAWLSRAFHPFVVSVFVLFLAQLLSGHAAVGAALWTLLAFAVVILPSLLFILFRVRQGRYEDTDVSVREDRHLLYGLAGLCFALLVVLLALLQAPAIAQRTLQAALLAFAVSALVNRFVNKLSLHSLAMTVCSMVLLFVSPLVGVAFGIITLFVGWARLHLTRHTLAEVLGGWVIGAGCVGVWFWLFLNA